MISTIVGIGGVVCYVTSKTTVVCYIKSVENLGCVGAVLHYLVQNLVPLGEQSAVGFESVDILLHVIQALTIEVIALNVFFRDEGVGRFKDLSCDACKAVELACSDE